MCFSGIIVRLLWIWVSSFGMWVRCLWFYCEVMNLMIVFLVCFRLLCVFLIINWWICVILVVGRWFFLLLCLLLGLVMLVRVVLM